VSAFPGGILCQGDAPEGCGNGIRSKRQPACTTLNLRPITSSNFAQSMICTIASRRRNNEERRKIESHQSIPQPQLRFHLVRDAVVQFIDCAKLEDVIGRKFSVVHAGCRFDLIPLPHPSGASPWHKFHPEKHSPSARSKLIARHRAIQDLAVSARVSRQ